ncbi:class V aminotransferase [Candidatus Termititenax persephonae]|uniref:Tritium exchange subunit n=1 Tax=Candidatus Termititenax persephonae TaxID=2218525 RepID=A0A388TGG3_9BACT|nr:class V aminotransferase [Candidatus Termititenax persephonae]
MKKYVSELLMIPGPTPVPSQVALAGAQNMMSHRSGPFKKLMLDLTAQLQALLQTNNEVVILSSSGTGGMEAVVSSCFAKGDKVLVATVGNFGKRWVKLAKVYGLDTEVLEYDYGQAVDPSAVKALLANDTEKKIKGVFFQMNETSTAVLNDVEEIAKVVKAHGALVIVDAISGFLASDLKIDEWGLDVVITGSQKAFMLPPGLAVVAVSARAKKAMEASDLPHFYLSLPAALKQAAEGQTPYTPAVSLIYQLSTAVKILTDEGLESILARHERLTQAVRSALRSLGMRLLNENDKTASRAVTAVYPPDGLNADEIRQRMKDDWGITLSNGQDELKGKIFRIGHLGHIDPKDVLAVIACLEIVLSQLGMPGIQWGKGVQAAQNVLARK